MIKCLVCGYILRKASVDINKHAMPSYNKPLDIKYCPFCGVSMEWFGEEDKRVLGSDLNLDGDTTKIMDHAMKLEVFNGDFYKVASEKCSNEENKRFFKALSNIEYTHAHIHKRIIGLKDLPKLANISYERFKKDEDFLKEAIKREEHAISYYNRYYDKVCSKELKTLFEILSTVEKQHITLASVR